MRQLDGIQNRAEIVTTVTKNRNKNILNQELNKF
jgi:hypothetical protein